MKAGDKVMNEETGDKVMNEEAGDKFMNEETSENVMNEEAIGKVKEIIAGVWIQKQHTYKDIIKLIKKHVNLDRVMNEHWSTQWKNHEWIRNWYN